MKFFLIYFFLLSTVAISSPRYSIDLEVTEDSIEKNIFRFKANITNIDLENYCLYIAYNDLNYLDNVNQRIDNNTRNNIRNLISYGKLEIVSNNSYFEKLNSFLYKS